MAVERSREEVWRIIAAFLDGTGGRWDWDDFTCIGIKDPVLDKIRSIAACLPDQFPADTEGWYCNAAGLALLRRLGDALRDGLDPVALLRERWTAFYAGDASVRPEAVTFFLDFVESCSDLDVRYLHPTDRLIGDLSFGARVRNWDVKFYEQFEQRFGYRFDPALAPVHDATLDEWIRIVSGALDL